MPKAPLLSSSLKRTIARLPRQVASYIQPMQPQMVDTLPFGSQWQYEVKWDGYRAVAVKRGQEIRLYSRNRKDLTRLASTVVEQLRQLPCTSAVVDGELVALDEQGRPSFSLLQSYGGKNRRHLALVAFDLLNLEDRSVMGLPLTQRQELLGKLTRGTGLQLSDPLNADLETVLNVVRERQLEGIVAKDRSSTYEPGRRGRSWFKHRVGFSQDFVVAGFTKGTPFDSLLVGYYTGRKLTYAGKVKAGFISPVRRNLASTRSSCSLTLPRPSRHTHSGPNQKASQKARKAGPDPHAFS